MTAAHAVVAWLVVAATAAVVAVSIGVAAGVLSRRVMDAVILVHVGVVGLAVLSGLVLPIVARPPADPLHLLYAVLAVAMLPVARYLVRRRRDTAMGGWLALAGALVAGVVLRLFMTGG